MPYADAAAPRHEWIWFSTPLIILAYLATLPSQSALASQPARVVLWTASGLALALAALGAAWLHHLSLQAAAARARAAAAHAHAARRGRSLARWVPLYAATLAGAAVVGLGFNPPPAALGQSLFLVFTAAVFLAGVAPAMRAQRAERWPRSPWSQAGRDAWQLTKPGLNGLVVVTTFIGCWMGSPGALDPWLALRAVLATALTAGGASVLNQYMERDLDALMTRTAGRPLPTRRMAPLAAYLLGTLLILGGLLTLASTVNLLSAFIAALTVGSYLWLYTPLKRINSLSTLAGAISGALPPVIGWAATAGSIGPGAQVLFFILFLWQEPHFLAIAWKYREQYGAAGCPLYAVLDPLGRATARQAILYTGALLGTTLGIVCLDLSGWVYLGGAIVLGAAFLAFGIHFYRNPTPGRARALFFASIAYLPLLLTLMVLDH